MDALPATSQSKTNGYYLSGTINVMVSWWVKYSSGPGCSKLTMSLVKTLKFQALMSQICQYFLLKKCEKLVQKLFSFFQK